MLPGLQAYYFGKRAINYVHHKSFNSQKFLTFVKAQDSKEQISSYEMKIAPCRFHLNDYIMIMGFIHRLKRLIRTTLIFISP